MKKIFSIFIFFIFSATINAQNNCGYSTKTALPFNFAVNNPLTPDPCGAKPPYNTVGRLTVSPPQGYIKNSYSVEITTKTIIDENCNVLQVEVSRDTILTGTKTIFGEKTEPTKALWVVRTELLTIAPHTRPSGFMATLLPNSHQLGGYWITHFGEYNSFNAADNALKELKTLYPEFCSAFVYKMPACEFRFEY